jgi:hypothetical protein
MARYSPVPVRVRFADGTSAAGPALFVGPGVCASASEPNFDRPPKRPLTMTPPQPFTKISNAKMTETPPNNRPQNYYNYPNTLSLNLQGSSTSVLNGPSTGRRLVQSFPGIPSDAAEANSEDLTNGSAAGEVQRLSAKPPISIALPIIPPLPHFVSSPPSATSQHTPMASFESLPNPQTPPGIWMVDQPKNGIVIGNLYLSSCPGKKVRLNGPIKGRGAICRDLGADLARVKSNGVYLIIWYVIILAATLHATHLRPVVLMMTRWNSWEPHGQNIGRSQILSVWMYYGTSLHLQLIYPYLIVYIVFQCRKVSVP